MGVIDRPQGGLPVLEAVGDEVAEQFIFQIGVHATEERPDLEPRRLEIKVLRHLGAALDEAQRQGAEIGESHRVGRVGVVVAGDVV